MNLKIYNNICKIIMSIIPDINLSDLTNNELSNCGVDSFEYVKLILLLEEKYHVSFDDDMYNKNALKRVEDFVEYIDKLQKEQKNE